jgi:hypothetical protein
MNWFQRHLNWTYVLTYLLAFILAFLPIIVVASAFPDVSVGDDPLSSVVAIGQLVAGIIVLIVNIWVIDQKGRSFGWLLLIGWLAPLWLSNKKDSS